MNKPNERVLSEIREQQQISVDELLRLIERRQPADEPGITENTVVEYGQALNDDDLALDARSEALNERNIGLTDGTVRRELNDRITTSHTWQGDEVLYRINDDRVSVYPLQWHEALGGTTDLTECVVFIQDASGFQEAPGVGTAGGVPEEMVRNVAAVVGGFDPEEVAAQLDEQKEQGELIADSAGLRSREAETGESKLPPVIDIRDALDAIEINAQSDVSGEINGIRKSLGEFNERDRAGQDSLLSDIERDVVSLRPRLAGDTDRRAKGILNRIQKYRDTSTDESATLSLSDATLLDGGDSPIDIAEHRGDVATFDGTLVNGGDTRDAVAVLTLYADDGTAVKTTETQTFNLGPDERCAVEQTVHIPEDAASYASGAFDAGDTHARLTTVGQNPDQTELPLSKPVVGGFFGEIDRIRVVWRQ